MDRLSTLVTLLILVLMFVASVSCLSGLNSKEVSGYCNRFCKADKASEDVNECLEFCMLAARR